MADYDINPELTPEQNADRIFAAMAEQAYYQYQSAFSAEERTHAVQLALEFEARTRADTDLELQIPRWGDGIDEAVEEAIQRTAEDIRDRAGNLKDPGLRHAHYDAANAILERIDIEEVNA